MPETVDSFLVLLINKAWGLNIKVLIWQIHRAMEKRIRCLFSTADWKRPRIFPSPFLCLPESIYLPLSPPENSVSFQSAECGHFLPSNLRPNSIGGLRATIQTSLLQQIWPVPYLLGLISCPTPLFQRSTQCLPQQVVLVGWQRMLWAEQQIPTVHATSVPCVKTRS